ncbi:MAG: hypothetical protein JWR19_3073 [Pedosphaera sp.]|jgi:hypothetical protein|nr:hypothetical protein [Pedosphaera sp.]
MKRENGDYDNFIRRLSGNPLACRVKIADLENDMDVHRLSNFTPKEGSCLPNTFVRGSG